MSFMIASGGLEYGLPWLPWWVFVLIFAAALVAVICREQQKLLFTGGALLVTVILLQQENSFAAIKSVFLAPHSLVETSFVVLMYLIYEYCSFGFMQSGLAERIAEAPRMQKRFNRTRNWLAFWPSALLDNVLCGKIAKKVTLMKHGQTQIGPDDAAAIVNAANAGGAWSILGDTTSIMIAAQVLVTIKAPLLLFTALPACIVFQLVINWFTPADIPGEPTDVGVRGKNPLNMGKLWPFLAVPGLMAGLLLSMLMPELPHDASTLAHYVREAYPLIGLVGGFLIGLFMERKFYVEIIQEVELWVNICFIALLLTLSHYLPAVQLVQALEVIPPVLLFLGIAILSGILDNIALTQALILLAMASGKPELYPWGLIAYAVGTGGSLFWSGSSAGINVTMPEGEHAHHKVQRGFFGWVVHIAKEVIMSQFKAPTKADYNASRDVRYWLGKRGWTYRVFCALLAGYFTHIAIWWWLIGWKV